MTGLDEPVNSSVRIICELLIILQIICCHFPAQLDILSPMMKRDGIGPFQFWDNKYADVTEKNINLEIRCHLFYV